ncbi:hypothetical protein BDV98DRAFT_659192 [Pterulicium gracile]|uniref:Uncharacterized protein n=1 Tax=Pterulicium gracile TaxID=1884261 RepID=A0A5C3Q4C2_9AGAR|nr:hypothetical protein BDV98DRAFT_659192 [Pterula gracilis]
MALLRPCSLTRLLIFVFLAYLGRITFVFLNQSTPTVGNHHEIKQDRVFDTGHNDTEAKPEEKSSLSSAPLSPSVRKNYDTNGRTLYRLGSRWVEITRQQRRTSALNFSGNIPSIPPILYPQEGKGVVDLTAESSASRDCASVDQGQGHTFTSRIAACLPSMKLQTERNAPPRHRTTPGNVVRTRYPHLVGIHSARSLSSSSAIVLFGSTFPFNQSRSYFKITPCLDAARSQGGSRLVKGGAVVLGSEPASLFSHLLPEKVTRFHTQKLYNSVAQKRDRTFCQWKICTSRLVQSSPEETLGEREEIRSLTGSRET